MHTHTYVYENYEQEINRVANSGTYVCIFVHMYNLYTEIQATNNKIMHKKFTGAYAFSSRSSLPSWEVLCNIMLRLTIILCVFICKNLTLLIK